MSNCFKDVRILKGSSGSFFAKAVTCGELTCEHCREQIIGMLKTKILYASDKYDMNQFFTLTTNGGYDDLIDNFTILRKKMNDLQRSRFIRKTRGKDQAEKVFKYNKKINEIIDFEIETMFFHRYMTEEAVKIARREDVYYLKMKNKDDFIRKHHPEVLASVKSRLVAFKEARLPIFSYEVSKEQRLAFDSYEELRSYCFNKITRNDEDRFHYIRILEFAGKPHFHMLTNRYIPHYVMASLLLGRKAPTVGLRDVVYLNKDLSEFSSFENTIQAQKAITLYVVKYITKELGQAVEAFEGAYKGKRRIDIIKSSQGIDTALNTSFKEEEADDEEKYVMIDTFPNRAPRSSWEKIEGSYFDYVLSLEYPDDVVENPSIKPLRNNYLNKENKIKELNANKSEVENYHEKKREIELEFTKEKCRIETIYLRNQLNEKLREDSVPVLVSEDYLHDLSRGLFSSECNNFTLEEKAKYLSTQHQFVKDLSDPKKRIITLLGNAGSGKTTTIAQLSKYLKEDHNIEYAALSAKASTVLGEKGLEAKTIHRLCKAKFSTHIPMFNKNENNPLEADVVVIDEISMVTKYLFGLLLNALPSHTKIILLGDPNQINPVGSNNLIFEFENLKSSSVSFNRLNINFRSNEGVSKIANDMKDGNLEGLEFKKYSLEKVQEKIGQGYQVITNSLVLSEEINLSKNNDINKNIVLTSFYNYHPGQEVMILRNDQKNEIYNGNTCKIIGIEEKEVKGKLIPTVLLEKSNGDRFNYSLVKSSDYFQPSYAITIHKSQGSEFNKVAIVLDNKDMLLNNNLLYTAITRAKDDFEIYIKDGVDTKLLIEKQENDDFYNLVSIQEKEDYLKIA